MHTRKLRELSVSALGLGCMGMSEFYGPSDRKEAINTIQHAYHIGINFFDTADIYGYGHNEILVGEAIRGLNVSRANVIIATKCGIVRDEKDPTKRGIDNSPTYIRARCDESLKRLNLDYIDLYYLHRIDPKAPIEESMATLAELVNAGKIRYIGLSEASVDTIRRAHKIHPVTAIQFEYSLMTRIPEKNGVLALCRELNIGFVPYSPIARGLLTGEIKKPQELAENDFRKNMPRFQTENLAHNLKLVAAAEMLAQTKSCTVAQLTLAWVLAQGEDTVPIPGTRRVKYLEDNANTVNIKFTQDELRKLDEVFKVDVVQGSRYTPEAMKLYNMDS